MLEIPKIKTLNEFQDAAQVTMRESKSKEMALCNWAMGLAGESGELVDMLKKVIFHDHPLDKEKVVKEIGDVLWYIAILAKELDVTLEEIGQRNIEKLYRRYSEGKFTPAQSMGKNEAAE